MNKIIVSQKKYLIAKTDQEVKGAFVNVQYKNEFTVIIEEEKFNVPAKEVEKDFKLLTFDMTLPFSMTGFVSKVSKVLADEKIPIFVISAFTTDHILIKDVYLTKAKKALSKIGFEEHD
jgi:hypothetical protein